MDVVVDVIFFRGFLVEIYFNLLILELGFVLCLIRYLIFLVYCVIIVLWRGVKLL